MKNTVNLAKKKALPNGSAFSVYYSCFLMEQALEAVQELLLRAAVREQREEWQDASLL